MLGMKMMMKMRRRWLDEDAQRESCPGGAATAPAPARRAPQTNLRKAPPPPRKTSTHPHQRNRTSAVKGAMIASNMQAIQRLSAQCHASVRPTSEVELSGNASPCFGSPSRHLLRHESRGSSQGLMRLHRGENAPVIMACSVPSRRSGVAASMSISSVKSTIERVIRHNKTSGWRGAAGGIVAGDGSGEERGSGSQPASPAFACEPMPSKTTFVHFRDLPKYLNRSLQKRCVECPTAAKRSRPVHAFIR